MDRLYSRSTGCTYLPNIHADIPADAVNITEERYQSVIANPELGKVRSHDENGLPILVDPPVSVPTVDALCAQVDSAADRARHAVAGDPLRAVEYERAAAEAKAYADAGYSGDVPAMVAAYVFGDRTAQQAADSILAEADQYNAALAQLRVVRLQAKEQIRALMADGETEEAQGVADHAVSVIESAVSGIGNNA